MRRFRYGWDGLCLVSILAYGLNRWLWKPHVHSGFMHDHFNDLLLMPAALPLLLWIHRWLGLRADDCPPTISEVAGHGLVWSLLFEGIGPLLVRSATGDLGDVIVYGLGGVVAWFWWNRCPQPSLRALMSRS